MMKEHVALRGDHAKLMAANNTATEALAQPAPAKRNTAPHGNMPHWWNK